MNRVEKPKIIHGLSNFHMAIVEKDDSEGVEYGSVLPVIGAISVNGTPNSDQTPKYADNGVFAILSSFDSFDVDMAAIDIPEEFQSEMFGEKVVNGVTFSNRRDIAKEIALGFMAELRGGGHRFYWLLKGTPEIMGIDHETDEGTIEAKDANLSIKFAPLLYNGEWRARMTTDKITVTEWFEDVVYGEEIAQALGKGEPDPED